MGGHPTICNGWDIISNVSFGSSTCSSAAVENVVPLPIADIRSPFCSNIFSV